MKSKTNLVDLYYKKIVKSLNHLEYSYNKALALPTEIAQLTENELETWDGFAARFARSSDIFLSKYIKAYVHNDDPAFEGSFKDYLNRAEKLRLIAHVEDWIEIRRMRNIVVHDYGEDDMENFFKDLIRFTPQVIELKTKLAHAS